ncbi:MAG: hypothetical protein ACRDY7_00075 [Acidimicrobiia bacterium]
MKRFVGLSAAIIALALPAAPAVASDSAPAEYRPECDQFYNSGKALFDPLIASPASAVLGPVEMGICGENKHVE